MLLVSFSSGKGGKSVQLNKIWFHLSSVSQDTEQNLHLSVWSNGKEYFRLNRVIAIITKKRVSLHTYFPARKRISNMAEHFSFSGKVVFFKKKRKQITAFFND